MIIPVNDEWRIASDKRQWIVQRKKTSKDKDTGKQVSKWDNESYWATVSGAVNGLANMRIRLHDSDTLTGAVDFIKNLSSELSQALAPMFTIDGKRVR